jgi:glycosyltransferase involved in cell wall biosynthesis
MRVLQVNAFAGKVGGAEIYCHGVMDELRARGHEVGFFAGDPERAERTDTTCIVRRPEFDPANLIHLHNTHHLSVGFVSEAARVGAPVIQTAHDFGYLCPNSWCVWPDGTVCEGGPGQKCFEHGCEANYPYDGRIVLSFKLRYEVTKASVRAFPCPSEFLARKLTAHGFPNAFGLPLWVEGAERAPRSREELPPRDPDRVLFLGRLVPEKGVEFLVRAWPRVLERFPRAVLSIVGGGPDQERLEGIAREVGLDPGAVFTGKVPHEQVAEHLERATCIVLPSIWCENSPVTTYESYRAGLPMVASDIAGLPAMVRPGETGLLARPRDAEDLAAKLCELLGDPALQARLQQGCLDSVERFTKQKHFDRLLAAYDQVLAEGPLEPNVDLDLLAASNAFLERFAEVEKWALDMQKHIQWLESQG